MFYENVVAVHTFKRKGKGKESSLGITEIFFTICLIAVMRKGTKMRNI